MQQGVCERIWTLPAIVVTTAIFVQEVINMQKTIERGTTPRELYQNCVFTLEHPTRCTVDPFDGTAANLCFCVRRSLLPLCPLNPSWPLKISCTIVPNQNHC